MHGLSATSVQQPLHKLCCCLVTAEGGDGDEDDEEDDEDEDEEDDEDVPPVGDNQDPPQTVGYKRFANGEQCYLFCRNILSNFHTHQPLNDVSRADLAAGGLDEHGANGQADPRLAGAVSTMLCL